MSDVGGNNGGQEIIWRYKTPLNSAWLAKNLLGGIDEGMADFPDPASVYVDASGSLILGKMSFYYTVTGGGKPGTFKVTTTESATVRLDYTGEYPIAIGYAYDPDTYDEYGVFKPIYPSDAAAFEGLIICRVNYSGEPSPVNVVSFDGVKRSGERYQLEGITAEPRLAGQLPCKGDVSPAHPYSDGRFFLKALNKKLDTYSAAMYNRELDQLEFIEYDVSNGIALNGFTAGKFYPVGYKAVGTSIDANASNNPIGIIGGPYDTLKEALSSVYQSSRVAYVLLGVIEDTGSFLEVRYCNSPLLKASWAVMEARRFAIGRVASAEALGSIPMLYDKHPAGEPAGSGGLFYVIMDMNGYIAGVGGDPETPHYDEGNTDYEGFTGKAWKGEGQTDFEFLLDSEVHFGSDFEIKGNRLALNPDVYSPIWKYLIGEAVGEASFENLPGIQSQNVYAAIREVSQHIFNRPGYLAANISGLNAAGKAPTLTGLNRVEIDGVLCVRNAIPPKDELGIKNQMNITSGGVSEGIVNYVYAVPYTKEVFPNRPLMVDGYGIEWPGFELHYGIDTANGIPLAPFWDSAQNGWYGYIWQNNVGIVRARAIMKVTVTGSSPSYIYHDKALLDSWDSITADAVTGYEEFYLHNKEELESWTCPESVSEVYVTAIAGGGGGGSGGGEGANPWKGGGGGSGGNSGSWIFRKKISVIPNQKYYISIGEGGEGGEANNSEYTGNSGHAGGDTWMSIDGAGIDPILNLEGGKGGGPGIPNGAGGNYAPQDGSGSVVWVTGLDSEPASDPLKGGPGGKCSGPLASTGKAFDGEYIVNGISSVKTCGIGGAPSSSPYNHRGAGGPGGGGAGSPILALLSYNSLLSGAILKAGDGHKGTPPDSGGSGQYNLWRGGNADDIWDVPEGEDKRVCFGAGGGGAAGSGARTGSGSVCGSTGGRGASGYLRIDYA